MHFISQLGNIINERYLPIEILGEGGWGVTYLAEDIQNYQKVALKVLTLKGLKDWKQIDLFEKEARILQQLQHRGIPGYLEHFTIDTADNHYFYLAQKLAPGKSLAEWVKDNWRATETEIKEIARQLLEILVYLHSLEPPIIHRDIKPSNIIRQEDGKIFLVDFGAVKSTYYSTLTGSSTVVGTYGYIAPEQFRGQATPASDLYSLGTTILFLLTHISPTELSTDGLQIKFRSRVNISTDLADWLEIMVEPEIEQRFKDAREALAVLKKKKKKNISLSIFPSKNILIEISIIILGIFIWIYFYKWKFLSAIGVVPGNICEPKVMENYLIKGGNPNAIRTPFLDESYSISKCFDNIKDLRLFKLFINKGGIPERGQIEHLANKKALAPEIAFVLYKNRINLNDTQQKELTLELFNTSKEIAATLIASGADINTKNRDGETLLHITKDREITLLAIEKGININAINKDGNTPLHLVSELESAKILLNSGANPNTKNNQGYTKLHLVALRDTNYNDREFARVLIDAGVKVNLQDNEGKTPLHLAVIHKSSTDFIEELLKAGANISIKDDLDKTPLDYAKIGNKEKVIKFLNSSNYSSQN